MLICIRPVFLCHKRKYFSPAFHGETKITVLCIVKLLIKVRLKLVTIVKACCHVWCWQFKGKLLVLAQTKLPVTLQLAQTPRIVGCWTMRPRQLPRPHPGATRLATSLINTKLCPRPSLFFTAQHIFGIFLFPLLNFSFFFYPALRKSSH